MKTTQQIVLPDVARVSEIEPLPEINSAQFPLLLWWRLRRSLLGAPVSRGMAQAAKGGRVPSPPSRTPLEMSTSYRTAAVAPLLHHHPVCPTTR